MRSIGKNILKGIFFCGSLIFVGCGSLNNIAINEVNQVCVKPNVKTNLHDLVSKVSEYSNSNYEYLNAYNDLEFSYLTFKTKECFTSLLNLKTYIDNNTSYILNVNKKAQKVKKGISLNNTNIMDVINYLNKDSLNKVEYFDENILLKNSNVKIYNIKDLEKYLQRTTPYYLRKVTAEPKNSKGTFVFYTLGYMEDNLDFNKNNRVVSNLERAKKSIISSEDVSLKNKLDEVVENIKNFN